jgi:hypothetical protein
MTMEEQAKPLRVQVDQEALRKIGRDLTAAFDTLATQFKAGAKRLEQAREVGALFQLYRECRDLDASTGTGLGTDEQHARQDEIRIQLAEAIKGYDLAYLANLATFGGWLADAAGKEWRSRT